MFGINALRSRVSALEMNKYASIYTHPANENVKQYQLDRLVARIESLEKALSLKFQPSHQEPCSHVKTK